MGGDQIKGDRQSLLSCVKEQYVGSINLAHSLESFSWNTWNTHGHLPQMVFFSSSGLLPSSSSNNSYPSWLPCTVLLKLARLQNKDDRKYPGLAVFVMCYEGIKAAQRESDNPHAQLGLSVVSIPAVERKDCSTRS